MVTRKTNDKKSYAVIHIAPFLFQGRGFDRLPFVVSTSLIITKE